MADLHARAVAENLLLALAGQAPVTKPRTELIRIVESVDSVMLVYRDPKHSVVLPSSRGFHGAKRFFEGHYLKVFRE